MYSISTKLGSALLVSIFLFFLVSITFSYQELNRTYSTIVSIAARSQLAQLSGSGSGLVAHYTFDEGSGITAGDSAGSNTGTLVNGPTWVTGKIGGGLTFDGTDDYVVRSIGDSATLLYKDGNVSTRSVSLWIKGGGTQTLKCIYCEGSNGASNARFEIGSHANGDAAGTLGIWLRNDSATSPIDQRPSSGVALDNSWHHVVWTDNNGTAKLYIDGVQDSRNFNYAPAGTYNLDRSSIGAQSKDTGQFFSGSVDDVRVYNRILSSSEVSDLYAYTGGSVTTPPADTTAPTISSIQSSSITTTGATISWTTNESSDTQIEYGLSTSYGSNTTLDTSLVTSHTQSLTGLTTNTTYHYRVKSKDAVLNLTTSSDQTFTTSAVSSPTTYNISVAKSGTGSGTVLGGTVSCGSVCSATVNMGSTVTLTATPAAGSTFTGWSGGCSGTSSCSLSSAASVTATFTSSTPPTSNRVDRLNSSGTVLQTFMTIQACANVATAGDSCVVYAGTYPERIITKANGSAGNYITFTTSGTVLIQGADINHTYNKVNGFEITNNIKDCTNSYIAGDGGVYIANAHAIVTNNYIHDVAYTGIFNNNSVIAHDAYVANNRIYKAQVGISIRGDRWLVENNEIDRPFPHCQNWDNDYMRFFGEDIVIRRNYLHGVLLSDLIPDPNDAGNFIQHTDCFQSWSEERPQYYRMINGLIEENMCLDSTQGVYTEGNQYQSYFHTLTIQNNIFARFIDRNLTKAGAAISPLETPNLTIKNNTIALTGGGIVAGNTWREIGVTTIPNQVIKNNIIYGHKNTAILVNDLRPLDPGDVIDYNIYLNRVGTGDTYNSGLHDIKGQDPLFVNVNDIVGPDNLPFTADDGLRLQSASPARGKAEDGTDMGAYQYGGTVTPPSTYIVTATKAGTGTGTVSGTGLSCISNTCTATVANSSSIMLTATPSTGSTFTGWSTGCTGTSTCTLSSTGSVTATFTLIPDTTLPTVTLTSPSGTISSTVTLSATASDNVGVTSVQFLIDNSLISTLTTAPYSGAWNTLGISDGTHTLTAIARDAAGNTKTSNPVTVTVNNNTAPVLSSIGSKSVTTGTPLSFTISASDAQSNPLTYTASSLPTGATFSNRVFTFTPSTTGTYTPRFTVSDGTLSDFEDVTITVTAPLPVSEDTDGDGVANANDKCPLTPLSLRSEVNIYGCPIPKTTKFTVVPNPATTDISLSLSSLEISNAYGKVTYATPVVLYRDQTTYKGQLDIDTNMNIQSNTVSLTSASLPELNKSATITLYNITHRTPRIMKDGILCTTCTFVSYSNNMYTFRVTGFSTYTVEETPTTGGGTTGSGGSSTSSTGTFTPTVPQLPVGGGSISTSTPSISPYSNLSLLLRNLYRGITGEDVRTLQRFLIIEGLLTIDAPTTYFGILTEAAVKAFQAKNSIVSSGTPYTTGYGSVGPKTRGVINAKISSSPQTISTPPVVNSSTINAPISKTLMYDMTDPQVSTLQSYLISKGYLTSQPTGYFGDLTLAAVKKLQCEKLAICSGTAETTGWGVVGPKTRSLLVY